MDRSVTSITCNSRRGDSQRLQKRGDEGGEAPSQVITVFLMRYARPSPRQRLPLLVRASNAIDVLPFGPGPRSQIAMSSVSVCNEYQWQGTGTTTARSSEFIQCEYHIRKNQVCLPPGTRGPMNRAEIACSADGSLSESFSRRARAVMEYMPRP